MRDRAYVHAISAPFVGRQHSMSPDLQQRIVGFGGRGGERGCNFSTRRLRACMQPVCTILSSGTCLGRRTKTPRRSELDVADLHAVTAHMC